MRNKQNKKKIMIAIMLSIIVAFIVYNSMNRNKTTIDKLHKTLDEQQKIINELKSSSTQVGNPVLNFKIAYAKQDIKSGTKLSLDMLELKDQDAQKKVSDGVNDLSFLAGQTVTADITKGDPVTKSKILISSVENFVIPDGMRAITIPSASIQGMASYITVGSKIDIISAQKDNNPEFIIQGAKIISFEGDKSGVSGEKFDGITLLLPVHLVPRLVDAMTNGKLQVIARSYNDNKIIKNSVRINKNLGNYSSSDFTVPPPPGGIKLPAVTGLRNESAFTQTPEKTKNRVVEVIQANVKSEFSFDSSQ